MLPVACGPLARWADGGMRAIAQDEAPMDLL